ncbi:MAG: ABC transporter ATP-binding protein [Actinobacteria bacterium]|nr:ABC transporter ATP-binding protein [Actinomycetota bacterium]
MTRNIVFSDISKSFGSVNALSHFSLSVDEGELVTLLGPSGCGKSTALRVAAGFEAADSGDVLIGGASVIASPANKRGIGMVFQNYSLFPHLKISENVEFGMRVRKMSRTSRTARVGELLDLVRLAGVADRYPHQISGGQQQRVALARALAVEPRVLLLDEPLSALDATVRVEVRDEIRRIQRASGIATVFVTHDQDEALAISDRICVMTEGRIEQVGTPVVVYRAPATAFVARFVGKVNDLGVDVVSSTKLRLRGHRFAFEMKPGAAGAGAAGREAQMLIRPEDVRVAAAISTEDSENGIHGVVRTINFGGATTSIDVQVVGTDHFVRVADNTRTMNFQIGDAVIVEFDTERALLI